MDALSACPTEDAVRCPTEDAVRVFLEYLVDPLIPAKSSVHDTPSLFQQQLVAKQMHGVVILYNYYHRKQHGQLEFLGFASFCKLIVVLKPSLLAYMKFMQTFDDTELVDPEKQLSLAEKTIMDACDMCMRLDSSKDAPNIEGWPISKVAVLLVDCRKENCLLLFSSITQGVWSLIEKDVEISNYSLDCPPELKQYKKKRITKRPLREDSCINEDCLRRLAFSTVKEGTDITEVNISVLESHTVYSLSKEKMAARLYIMQCTQHISEDVIQVPLKEAIDSLQGPLVRKASHGWTITSVVEYFHVLPYTGALSDWFYRDAFPIPLTILKEGTENLQVYNAKQKHSQIDNCGISVQMEEDIGNLSDGTNKLLNVESNEGCLVKDMPNDLDVRENMEEDNLLISAEETCKNIPRGDQKTSFMERKLNDLHDVSTKDTSVEPKRQNCIPESRSSKTVAGNNMSENSLLNEEMVISSDHALVSRSNSKDLDMLHSVLASKDHALFQTALRVLLKKRDKLSLQQRNIQDEVAQCDKCIQIITNGGEDALALKIDSIIEVCNDLSPRAAAQGGTDAPLEGQLLPYDTEINRSSEAVLHRKTPCQELDEICNGNTWMLPTYRVHAIEGGYIAEVMVKGIDFEYSKVGEHHITPHGARESAAAQALHKFQCMTSAA